MEEISEKEKAKVIDWQDKRRGKHFSEFDINCPIIFSQWDKIRITHNEGYKDIELVAVRISRPNTIVYTDCFNYRWTQGYLTDNFIAFI